MTPLREDTKGVSQAALRCVRVLSEDTPSKKRKKRAQARNQRDTLALLSFLQEPLLRHDW